MIACDTVGLSSGTSCVKLCIFSALEKNVAYRFLHDSIKVEYNWFVSSDEVLLGRKPRVRLCDLKDVGFVWRQITDSPVRYKPGAYEACH